jgi:isopenicillin N synthase-like dioxygenase
LSIEPVRLGDYDADFDRFSRVLGASFARYGFAVVADCDISAELIGRAQADARAFFALPDGVKRAYVVAGGAGQRGYTPFGVETAKGARHHDLKEFWHVGRDLPPGHPYRGLMGDNVWPTEIATFQANFGALYAALEGLGLRLLRAIARHLGLDDEALVAATQDGDSILRLLHYPPVAGGELGPLRAAAHEDINAITLLLGAEEAGLELLDRDGRWLPINPPPGCVVVNIGDMLQRLTNGVLPSTSHRVVNPAPERASVSRYSTPFFLHFAPDYRIETLPSCISGDRPDAYPGAMTARAFLDQRLREIKLR